VCSLVGWSSSLSYMKNHMTRNARVLSSSYPACGNYMAARRVKSEAFAFRSTDSSEIRLHSSQRLCNICQWSELEQIRTALDSNPRLSQLNHNVDCPGSSTDGASRDMLG
jgi:hypothetical protein